MLMYSTKHALFLSLLSLPQLIASLSHIQPEPTDSSPHGFQSDGWTPKPTSAPSIFIQKRQSSGNNVCGVLQSNSGMESSFLPLGFINRANITQSIRTIYLMDVATRLLSQAAVMNPQSRPAWDMSNSVCVIKTVRRLQTS